MLLQQGDERVRVSADELLGGGHLAVLEDHKGGHSRDAELLAQLGQVVHVNLGEEDVLELFLVGVATIELLVSRGVDEGFGFRRKGNATHLARMGAMALQGPHQVAKQSSMMVLCSLRASLKASVLYTMLASYQRVGGVEERGSLIALRQAGELGKGDTYDKMLWTVILGDVE